MVTSTNDTTTRRQMSINFRVRQYRNIRLWSIAGGIFSIVCFLLGSGIIAYSLRIGAIHLNADSLLPLSIFALACILGLIDVSIWFFSQISDIPTNYVSSSTSENALPDGQSDARYSSNGLPAIGEHQVSVREESGAMANHSVSASVSGTFQQAVSQEDTMITISDEITETLSKPLIKSPFPDDSLVVRSTLAFQHFIQPREGDNLERSQDKLAYNHAKGRYAVADGVSRSFLPAPWARIVAEHFRDHDGLFESQDEITGWLRACSEAWREWVEIKWVPMAQSNSGQEDWSLEIARGAATTFVGCVISHDDLKEQHTMRIRVVVAGDAEFFLVSPRGEGKWESKHFKLHLNEFGVETRAIATPEKRVERDYKWIHPENFEGRVGDCIVLTTDALAKWILTREQLVKDPWNELLSISSSDKFRSFVFYYRSTGDLEVDDTTMMVIPLEMDAIRDEDEQFQNR